MDQIITISEIILTIGGALVVILIVILLLYLIRIALLAKGIVGGVKKSVESAQQSILSPLSMLSGFFDTSDTNFDDLEE